MRRIDNRTVIVNGTKPGVKAPHAKKARRELHNGYVVRMVVMPAGTNI